MKEITKTELCEALAEDYADRAAKNGANYDESYNHYLGRCLARRTFDLMKQYKIQGLSSSGFVF
jgi:hypothetical protein